MKAAPPITEALLQEAKRKPGGWVYAIDPDFNPDAKIPPYGIIGAWPVDDQGNLKPEFKHNDKYRPSARALGWREPRSGLEAALQDLATGRLDDDTFVKVFATAQVHVFANGDRPGEIFVGRPENADPAVSAFTDVELLTATGHPANTAMTGCALAAALSEDIVIMVNPGCIPVGRLDPRQVLSSGAC